MKHFDALHLVLTLLGDVLSLERTPFPPVLYMSPESTADLVTPPFSPLGSSHVKVNFSFGIFLISLPYPCAFLTFAAFVLSLPLPLAAVQLPFKKSQIILCVGV